MQNLGARITYDFGFDHQVNDLLPVQLIDFAVRHLLEAGGLVRLLRGRRAFSSLVQEGQVPRSVQGVELVPLFCARIK